MNAKNSNLKQYVKPRLDRIENIRDLTRECANWQCSVTVPQSP